MPHVGLIRHITRILRRNPNKTPRKETRPDGYQFFKINRTDTVNSRYIYFDSIYSSSVILQVFQICSRTFQKVEISSPSDPQPSESGYNNGFSTRIYAQQQGHEGNEKIGRVFPKKSLYMTLKLKGIANDHSER